MLNRIHQAEGVEPLASYSEWNVIWYDSTSYMYSAGRRCVPCQRKKNATSKLRFSTASSTFVRAGFCVDAMRFP